MQTVTHSFEEVFDYGLPSDPATANAAPTRATLDVLARVAEAAFLRFLERAASRPEVTNHLFSLFLLGLLEFLPFSSFIPPVFHASG